MNKNYILNADTVARKITRLAYEIAERNHGEQQIILAGIWQHGSVIAHSIAKALSGITDATILITDVMLDKRNPTSVTLREHINCTNQLVILVDDVANSGKTMLHALKPFLSLEPRTIQTLVLVERTHKQFPIQADYVGLSVSNTLEEHIFVEIENQKITGAYMA
ncbi:MAG: phosphoribosyltransferase family protein [Chitinophagaceae bacterium]